MRSGAGGGIEIEFPDGTILIVTPGWWSSEGKWYLNVNVSRTPAVEGIMGAIPKGNWLPPLPNGTLMGPMPAGLHQRYVDLNKTFADAWRVTGATSLFDYAPGKSTATFTVRGWPKENPPCTLPATKPVKSLSARAAKEACREIADQARNAACVFDVMVTGERGFAKTYQLTQRIEQNATSITVTDDRDPTRVGEPVTFTATVTRRASGARAVPAGRVEFSLDGGKTAAVTLNAEGRAIWQSASLKSGTHVMTARYIPVTSPFLPSNSQGEPHTVKDESPATVTISGLPMQGGDEKTPCPEVGISYKRTDAATVPYLRIMLPLLDQQCGAKGPGLTASAVKFLRCAPDPRGRGFGPNATADITCSR